ncbi:hypothetical protein A2V49_01845 [candidate division WWE3 bacterium RBG_19FT_COMBO_34_6]|uniref:Uncharacterized protein n=1 Tax=candidate division WWE3 bacterium RBG_19FT_COMBO_34_6 TaxID=1802612 RepID=A0A1F4UMH4_UNCKA|nr:MAG: hypothetical protein A2V49_01845 [candidate division WWE3 bacterium RBG_19FT_COMBO_34_6]
MPISNDRKEEILRIITNKFLTKWQIYARLNSKFGITPDQIYNFLKSNSRVTTNRNRNFTTFCLKTENKPEQFCPPNFVDMSSKKFED